MKIAPAIRQTDEPKKNRSLLITVQSGLKINVYDNTWILLAHKGKGWSVNVGWLHSAMMPDEDRSLILEVFVFYARTKAASTTSGINTNAGPFLKNGFPALTKLKAIWSGLKTNKKKGLNQFFGALERLGNERFKEFHRFTSSHLDKNNRNALSLSKGALSEIEFDSLANQINSSLREHDWTADRPLAFYQSTSGFSQLRNHISNKLLVSIVRRPIQLNFLKWADAIPAGATFNDPMVSANNEIGTVGAQTLQLRVFIAKSKGTTSSRAFPERYPLHLSEYLSKHLLQYKQVYLKGLKLLMKSSGIKAKQTELVRLMNDMPMFPAVELFCMQFSSLDLLKSIFTADSTIYQAGENSITHSLRHISVASERVADCTATSNRIRHTVLTRGAQDGLPVDLLAKITGVTVPAARHYIDLDYKSRRMIDSNYTGNEFLKKAFSDHISVIEEGEECIFDNQFNPVGGTRNKRSCATCPTLMGRPLGCYGCPNFRPILEADHRAVLAAAEDKRTVNRNSLVNPLLGRSVEKLERQIVRIKYTIAFCDDVLSKQGAIDVE